MSLECFRRQKTQRLVSPRVTLSSVIYRGRKGAKSVTFNSPKLQSKVQKVTPSWCWGEPESVQTILTAAFRVKLHPSTEHVITHVCGRKDDLSHTEIVERTLVQATHQITALDISLTSAQTHCPGFRAPHQAVLRHSLTALPSSPLSTHRFCLQHTWVLKSTLEINSNPGLKLQSPELLGALGKGCEMPEEAAGLLQAGKVLTHGVDTLPSKGNT